MEDLPKGGGDIICYKQYSNTNLPNPQPPRGLNLPSPPSSPDVSLEIIGKFIKEKTSAITKRISSLRSNDGDYDDDDSGDVDKVKEFNITGIRVTKTPKTQSFPNQLKGRVTFFSRSNNRDCSAVRSFLRERDVHFVEINVDVYPNREKELFDRTGSLSVPQIFFNEVLIGGLVVLNSLRNGGLLDAKMEEILGKKCGDDAPAPPVYGFDDDGVDDDKEAEEDDVAAVVRAVRGRVPMRDRVTRMRIVRGCFEGSELVEAVIGCLDCGRKKAIEIGKRMARKHYIHHVFGENEFEDGTHLYRLLEHEPFVAKCHNFRGSVNDREPKNASALGDRLFCLLSAILETYASDDRRSLDYIGISNSEEFRRYVNLVEELQRVNLHTLTSYEKLAFFMNLHNGMAIHAAIRIGNPGAMIDRRQFFADFMYIIGGYAYSLSSIKNGILRGNRRAPFSLMKPFGKGDKRLELAVEKVNPLIHFGLWNATRGSPCLRFFTPRSVESELKYAAREFLQRDDAMQVDLSKRTVYISQIMKWYSADFEQEKEILKWIVSYLDASKAGLLTHLLSDGGAVSIVYQKFDWSLDS